MRIAIFAALALLATPVAALTPDPDGAFSQRVILITDEVAAPSGKIELGDGSHGSLTDYRGQVVVVTAWATWCHVCMDEMPIIDRVAAELDGQGVAFVPLSLDTDMPVTKIRRFYKQRGISNLPVMVDVDYGNASVIGVRGTPTSIIVDKFGQVVAAIEGAAPWDSAEMRGFLKELTEAETAEQSRTLVEF